MGLVQAAVVTGVDAGYEEVGRWGPGMVAIRVHVPSKTDEVTDDQRIPAEIEGGSPRTCWNAAMSGGAAGGHHALRQRGVFPTIDWPATCRLGPRMDING